MEKEKEGIYLKYRTINKKEMDQDMKNDPFKMFAFYCTVSDKMDSELTNVNN